MEHSVQKVSECQLAWFDNSHKTHCYFTSLGSLGILREEIKLTQCDTLKAQDGDATTFSVISSPTFWTKAEFALGTLSKNR